jgi:hypothetical protein
MVRRICKRTKCSKCSKEDHRTIKTTPQSLHIGITTHERQTNAAPTSANIRYIGLWTLLSTYYLRWSVFTLR